MKGHWLDKLVLVTSEMVDVPSCSLLRIFVSSPGIVVNAKVVFFSIYLFLVWLTSLWQYLFPCLFLLLPPAVLFVLFVLLFPSVFTSIASVCVICMFVFPLLLLLQLQPLDYLRA